MQIDCNQKLLDLDGNDMGSLGTAIQMACTRDLRGDESLSGDQKFRLWELALKSKQDLANFSVEETATIKDRIARCYPPAIVGPAFNLLDPKAE